MKDQINKIISEAEKFAITSKEELEAFKLKFLVKKGLVNQLFVDFKNLANIYYKFIGASTI